MKSFRFGKDMKGDFIYSIWIVDPSVPVETLRKAEMRFQTNKSNEDLDDLIEDLLGFSYFRSKAVEDIVNAAKKVSYIE